MIEQRRASQISNPPKQVDIASSQVFFANDNALPSLAPIARRFCAICPTNAPAERGFSIMGGCDGPQQQHKSKSFIEGETKVRFNGLRKDIAL